MTMERPSDRLFKYPPMERQDLNQSQLGSFKFTPVDNVGSLQAIATSYMNSQINAYLARVKASSSSSSDRPSHPAGGIVKADFFNKHIKPDLGDSRLRLGPAAVRSAVEGAATSPTRQGHMLSDQMNPDRLSTDQIDTSSAASFHPSGRSQLTQGNVSHYRIPVSMNHQPEGPAFSPYLCTTVARSQPENNHPATFSMPQSQDSNIGSNNSPFMPANPRDMSIGFPDPALINQSLSLALITEQRVHELTRATLREQIEKNLRLQAELDHSNERVRKLQMRMRLMKDAPNDSADVESGPTHVPDPNGSIEAVRVAVAQANDEGSAKGNGLNPNEDEGCQKPATATNWPSEVKEAVGDVTKNGAASEVDESKLFNLDILEGSGLEGTLCSHARQTLRKHFFVDPQQETIATTPAQQPSNKLIEVSPESASGESCPVEPRVAKLLSLFQVPSASTNSGPESTTTMSSYDNIKNLRTTDDPVPEVPAAFLAKYGKKPVVNEEDGLQDGLYSFENKPATQYTSKTNPVKKGSEDQDGLTGVKTPATTDATETLTFIGEIPSKFPGQPMWKIHKDNPIFYDNSEKQRAKHFSGIPLDPTSQFYNHPVRYFPEDGMKSKDTFRTVMIDHIPLGTCANEVLRIIRGGAVESIELVGPIGKVTNYMTARVVFIFEDSAMAMAKLKDLEINSIKVHCWLVREPTYPRSGEMEEFVTGGLDATRILWVNNITIVQYTQIQGVIMDLGLGRQLIGLSWAWESRAVLEFASIKAAVKAAQGILKRPVYQDATVSFDEDYTCKE